MSVRSLNSSIKFDRKLFKLFNTHDFQHIVVKHKFQRSLRFKFIYESLKIAKTAKKRRRFLLKLIETKFQIPIALELINIP